MSLLFISHSSSDNEITQRLALGLKAKGMTSIFLDFDPEVGIPLGSKWERELYLQLRRADAVLFLSSQESVASRWCFAELAIARSLGKPIFPFILEPSMVHPLLSDVQHLSLAVQPDLDIVELIQCALQNSGIDPNLSVNVTRPPYPGLESFTEDDAAIFFGRSAEIRDVLNLINRSFVARDIRAITVIGPSGSGKSSLVRAGVIPRLLPKERWVILPRMIPGAQPLENLAMTLTIALERVGVDSNYEELLGKLNEDLDYFRVILNSICKHAMSTGSVSCLLFVDQFEELFTLSSPAQRQQFLQLLEISLSTSSSIFFIGTLRSEYLNQLLQEPYTGNLEKSPWLLRTLTADRLSEVIEAPAVKFGLEFAPGLINRIVADTEGGDALPLLSFTLNQLYRKLEGKTYISMNMYEEIGGVIGALQHQADEVVAVLEQRGQGAQVEPALLKLVGIGRDRQPVRRRVSRNALSDSENAILQLFLEARLLKSDQDNYGATLEIAHEALLRQWSPIKLAIEQSQDKLLTFARLSQLASDWESAGGHPGFLQAGAGLIHLLSMTNEGGLSKLEQAYLEASIAWASPPITLRLVSAIIDLLVVFVIVFIEAISLDFLPLSEGDAYYPASFWSFFVFHFVLIQSLGYKLGWSPGIRLTRLVLFARDGSAPTWGQAIFRSLIFWLPFQDRLSGTILLRK